MHGSSDDWNKMDPKFRNRLLSELTRLKAEVEHLMVFCNCTLIPNKELQAENARLKAEVERLTKESDIFEKCCEHQKNRIERLKAEVDELTFENSQYEEHHKYGQNVITSLREQVERLTKAGDAMWQALLCSGCSECEGMYDSHDEAINDWNAVKEGKQP